MSDTFGIPTLLADFDQEDALRVQQELYAQRFRDQQEVSQAIDGICRSAWYDFYAHEPVQCGQLLGSLEVASPQPPLPSDDLLETTNMDKVEGDVSLGADVFQRWSGDLQATSILSSDVELSLPPLRSYAYPKYESCAPSIEIARYVDDSRILRFVPYADEPAFEAQAYCSAHVQIGWQSEWFDVDFKLIVADALLRLEAAEINRDKIDQLKPRFLPYPGGDLMTSLGKRDILGWGSGALQTFHATLGSVVGSPPLLSEINSLVAHFCSSLNCNKAKCMLHDIVSPPVVLSPPTITNVEMYDSKKHKRRCGEYCFLSQTLANFERDIPMEQNICDIVKLFPQESPCKLAPLARTSCSNIFHHQYLLFPDGQEADAYIDIDTSIRQGLEFCAHTGACAMHNCYCYRNGLLCQRRCRCSLQCELRVFCKCGQHHHNRECSCLAYAAECDPDLCKRYRKRGKGPHRQKHICSNIQAQLNRVHHLAVKIGTWGLGTFAVKAIPAKAFLGEYISEKLYVFEDHEGGKKLIEAQEMVHKFRGLNYAFGLEDNSHCLDAATLGNTLRYINDPKGVQKVNVTASAKNVAGELKILFFTTKAIQPGQELMLEYGEAYWRNT